MYLATPKDGFHFTEQQIAKISNLYQAVYMGYWCTKSSSGQWNEQPVDVFYVEQPDRTKGHTNYFGMYMVDGSPYICEASSVFSEPIRRSRLCAKSWGRLICDGDRAWW